MVITPSRKGNAETPVLVESDEQLWGFLERISWAGGQFKLPAREDLNKKLRWRIAHFLFSHRRTSARWISRYQLERVIGRGMFDSRFGRLSVWHVCRQD